MLVDVIKCVRLSLDEDLEKVKDLQRTQHEHSSCHPPCVFYCDIMSNVSEKKRIIKKALEHEL